MIRLELTAAVAAFMLLAIAPAQACGPDDDQTGCGPPPKPPVVTPEPPKATLPNDDRDPMPLFSQPDAMPCCQRDGVVLYHAPLGLARAGTRAYCAAVDLSVIPSCKTWVRK